MLGLLCSLKKLWSMIILIVNRLYSQVAAHLVSDLMPRIMCSCWASLYVLIQVVDWCRWSILYISSMYFLLLKDAQGAHFIREVYTDISCAISLVWLCYLIGWRERNAKLVRHVINALMSLYWMGSNHKVAGFYFPPQYVVCLISLCIVMATFFIG